jgi:hypothetical protein
MGTMLWRADRWRRGQSSLAEVANRLDALTETLRWRTTEGGELEHIVAASAVTRRLPVRRAPAMRVKVGRPSCVILVCRCRAEST